MVTCVHSSCDSEHETVHGMRIHHSRSHGYSVAGEELTCESCGGEYVVQRDKAEDSRFCSRECMGDWRSETVRGENHPRYNQVELECHNCGSEFTRAPSLVDSERVYCSQNCKYEWISENLSGSNHKNYSKVECECYECGETFKRIPSEAEKRERNFCSQDCYWLALRELSKGENNPSYKHGEGEHYYGANWRSIASDARERDDYECQSCRMGLEEHQERFDRVFPVHHVVPFRLFDDKDVANQLANLLTLCCECHMKYERKSQRIPEEAVSA